MEPGSGISWGEWSDTISPPLRYTWYSTEGAVARRSSPNSRSNRSLMTSMCRRPRKPTRKPKPRAWEVSGSHTSAGSFSDSFSSASFKGSYWSPSMGKRPVNTMGFASR